jgi:dynein heavy chain 2
MDLDLETGVMKVFYSDGLITLIREFRQMTELGFKR